MFVARPENGRRLRSDASAPTPLRSRRAVQNPGPNVTIHPEDHAMLGLHPFSHYAVRLGIAVGSLAAAACGENTISGPTLDPNLSRIAGFDQLKAALVKARNEPNGGFNLDMWAAVVDRNGLVVAVVFTGATSTDQWPGSRVIAAQKANTANARAVRPRGARGYEWEARWHHSASAGLFRVVLVARPGLAEVVGDRVPCAVRFP